MRFLLDENLPPEVSEVLRESEHDVRAITRSNLQGASDEAVWLLAASEERFLMTRDLGFPLDLLPKPLGLILIRVPPWYLSKQIAGFISEATRGLTSESLSKKTTVLAPGRKPRMSEW